jgi:hypothetical protein
MLGVTFPEPSITHPTLHCILTYQNDTFLLFLLIFKIRIFPSLVSFNYLLQK